MFHMLYSRQISLTLVHDAAVLALELAKWYAIGKSDEDILQYLRSKSSDEETIKRAVLFWISSFPKYEGEKENLSENGKA